MKKKTLLLIIGLLLTLSIQVVTATQIYSTEKLNDGTYIRKCRYSNGKVDYCTQKDALKAIEVFNNPWKYMTTAQKAQWEKNNNEAKARDAQEKVKQQAKAKIVATTKAKDEAELMAVVTSKKLITSKVSEYQSELNKLKNKEDVGISIDHKLKELLEYKLSKLNVDKSSDLELTYKRAKEYYAGGKISKQDFEESIRTLKFEDEKIVAEYNKIVALTSVDSETYRGATQQTNSNTNYYTDPKSPLNILNTTTNTIQAGKNLMDQIKMLKGY